MTLMWLGIMHKISFYSITPHPMQCSHNVCFLALYPRKLAASKVFIQTTFPVPLLSLFLRNHRNTSQQLSITFIFDRSRNSFFVLALVKYKRKVIEPLCNFATSNYCQESKYPAEFSIPYINTSWAAPSFYSLSGRTSYCKISWRFKAARFVFSLFQWLRNFIGTSAAALNEDPE